MVKAGLFKKILIQCCLLLGCSCWGQETYHLDFLSTDSVTISNGSSDTVMIDSVNIHETIGAGYGLYMLFFTDDGIYIQGFNGYKDRREQGNTSYTKWPMVLKPKGKLTIKKINVDFLDPLGTADYILPRKYVYHEFTVRFNSKSIQKEIKVIGDVGLWWEINTAIRTKKSTAKTSTPAHVLHSVDGKRVEYGSRTGLILK